MPETHIGASLSPGNSTFDTTPCQWSGMEKELTLLGPYTHAGDPEKVPECCAETGQGQAIF